MIEILQPGEVNERCGLVLKDGTVVEIANVALNPEIGYEMDPVAVLPFIEQDLVASTWHTHPTTDPNLSGEDYVGFLSWPDLTHIILGYRKGEPTMVTYRVEDGLVLVCD